ncbi:primosomal protein N' [Candidatus Marinamargulisbacteria bacterium SCGC AG-410-N11]|nr:primosomal protein N' [Candidatus Marinamargulisbacteria bacterium SCGC AG-410-N11]
MEPTKSQLIANILIHRGVNQLYSYQVPENLISDITIGRQVKVPFGRFPVNGLVMSLSKDPVDHPLKPIIDTLKKKPLIPEPLIDLIEWFYNHYQTTPFKAYQTIIGTRNIRKLNDPKPSPNVTPPPYSLNTEQNNAIKTILKQKGSYHEAFLHGITGSGKTEVYMQLAETIRNDQKQVLILVPEIALTPQFTRNFTQRFGESISVIHSNLTAKEREIEWNKINEGHISIVIGPRSAIFAPLSNLGLIVIDEEHESTYKQENHPRYDTHSVARKRAKNHNALLVFGSATPSIDTYFHCQKESGIKLLELPNRVSGQPLPQITVIDRQEEAENGIYQLISPTLQKAIQHRLIKKEKVLILINRRGYAPYCKCQRCETSLTCPSCNLNYTYHHDRTLRCHRCDRIEKVTSTCPKCKKNSIAFEGTGTQKVEMELKKLYPNANINRLDKDTAKNVTDMDNAISKFKDTGDILIGTQLIAKGHHIESVTLVGVLGIDTSLSIPDFRSSERAFNLITQVAGRAGRGKKRGEVFVQTSNPHHYSITHAKTHNFKEFYKEECVYRQELFYPPYCSLINVIISSEDLKDTKAYAQKMGKYIKETLAQMKEEVPMLGPKPAPIEMVRKHYRWNILLKIETPKLEKIKAIFPKAPKPPSNVRSIIDFDPWQIL